MRRTRPDAPKADKTLTGPKVLRALMLAASAAAGFLVLAACETSGGARPPAPVYTGQTRVEPDPPAPPPVVQPETPPPMVEVAPPPRPERRGFTPPHMQGRDIKRLAVLLPFSSRNANVRREADSMLAAIELALFDTGTEAFALMPKDTGGDAVTAARVAKEAIDQGADVLIGPLFGSNVAPVAEAARAADVPVVAFSNDLRATGSGAFLLSFPPEEEIERIVDYAVRQGVTTFALLGPEGAVGQRSADALRLFAAERQARVASVELYGSDNSSRLRAAERLVQTLRPIAQGAPGTVAVILPSGGVELRSAAPLVGYYGLDTRIVRLLGTAQWDDPGVWREPALVGQAFAAPAPEERSAFARRFQSLYGQEPSRLASLGYDAAALAIGVARTEPGGISRAAFANPDGFIGLDGLFRFRADGMAQRSLAVYVIGASGGARVVDRPATSFTGGS